MSFVHDRYQFVRLGYPRMDSVAAEQHHWDRVNLSDAGADGCQQAEYSWKLESKSAPIGLLVSRLAEWIDYWCRRFRVSQSSLDG